MKETTNKRPKTGGRAKGTPNKITTEIREFYKELIENNLEQIETDLKELNPKERIEILIKLSEYVVPKLARTEIIDENQSLYNQLKIKGIIIES